MRKIILAVAAVLGLLLAVAPTSASTGWTIQPTPGNVKAQSAVSCASSSACVSVGDGTAMHWNGSNWAAMRAPYSLKLNGVACPSATYCIAVGWTHGLRAGAWRWNGSTWTAQTAFNPKSVDNGLNAIACSSRTSCEAVGTHGNGITSYPLAEFWNGKTWANQSTSGAPAGSLAGVACESTSVCEAVGVDTAPASGETTTPLVMGLSGSRWVTQPPPSNPLTPPQAQFNSVSCWSAGCVAVGRSWFSDQTNGVLIGVWDVGRDPQWSVQEEDDGVTVPPGVGLNGVHCVRASASETGCTAVGMYTDNISGATGALIETWLVNSGGWVETFPNGMPSGSDDNVLNGIACVNSGSLCTAVGSQRNAANGITALAERN